MKLGLGRLCLATTAATAVFFILGCGKSDDKDAKKPGADGSAPEVVVDESRSVLPDGLDTSRLPAPFEGTIRLERQAGLAIYEVTYTVAPGRIRREAVCTNALLRKTGGAMARAGVVVDVERKEALLYRNRDDDRHFVRLDLEAYRKLLGAHLTYEPLDTRHGFSTHFADLPRDRKLAAVNQEEAVTVGGILCDHLVIVEDACLMTVDHSRQLKVDRGLLELTEAGMPAEVKWFPVKVVRAGRHQLGLAGQGAPAKIDELVRQAEKGITDALNSASKALSRPLRVVAVAPGKAEASAFTLPANLKEVASYEEFEKKWAEAEAAAAAKSPQSSKGSHHHWHD